MIKDIYYVLDMSHNANNGTEEICIIYYVYCIIFVYKVFLFLNPCTLQIKDI